MFAGGSKTIFQNMIGRSRFGSSWLARIRCRWIRRFRMRIHRMINFWIFISVGRIWKRLKIWNQVWLSRISSGWMDRTSNGLSSVIFRLTLSQLAAIFFLKFPDTVWILLIWFLLFSSGIRPFVEPITEGSFEGFELVPLCFWAFVVGLEAPGTRFGLDSFLLFYDNMIHNIWPIFIIFFLLSQNNSFRSIVPLSLLWWLKFTFRSFVLE